MMSHEELRARMLQSPDVRTAYETQQEEFRLFDELSRARKRAKLTQAEVAARMGTQVSAVSRLEAARYPPSLRTLQRYATAIGCRVDIRLVPVAVTSRRGSSVGKSKRARRK